MAMAKRTDDNPELPWMADLPGGGTVGPFVSKAEAEKIEREWPNLPKEAER